MVVCFLCFFFFFQAEDGIRDADVTGVQTCALPIYGRLAEIDVFAHTSRCGADDDDDLVEAGGRRGVSDDGAQQGRGPERQELLGLADTGGGTGREDEAGHERPHRWSNASLQARQQKYTVCSPTSERYLALATSTVIPQTGSVASIESARDTSGLPLRWCKMISARMLTAISAGSVAPMSIPAGALSRPRRSGGTPRVPRCARITAARRRLATRLTYPASMVRTSANASSSRSA